ncbi:hypothetical protein ScPMuIL_012944 [Solemya velum]
MADASFFHEIWKRRQHEVGYDWDVADFEKDEETVRPEFVAAVRRKRLNPVNKSVEPYVPFWSKCYRYFTSITVLVFFFCLVLAALFGVIVYRVVIATVLYVSSDGIIQERTNLIASSTAAVINLIIILVLNFVYQKIALGLTDLEQHKTDTEWEDAFTFKMYLFQFVNYYSSIVYIAFFKGRFTGYPGNYDYIMLNSRNEECDPAGCLIELCVQLAIIMIGKQAFNNFKELILPKLVVWFRSREVKEDDDIIYSRWERDYHLDTMPALGLFDEYLEMVIQYGFVTVFVAAFPLAPLFAFLNNVIEIRLDAYKFVTQWRRPFAARAEDIGIWFGILRGISAIAIVTNAFIIAFTSEFIPKLVYQHRFNNGSMDGYIDFSLSHFKVEMFQNSSRPLNVDEELFPQAVTTCRYRDFRNSDRPEEFTEAYWQILVVRLAFIVVFENLVVFLSWLVMYLISDTPYYVKLQILREKYLLNKALLDADILKTQKEAQKNNVENS